MDCVHVFTDDFRRMVPGYRTQVLVNAVTGEVKIGPILNVR